MVLFLEEGRHVARTVPAGAIVAVEPESGDGGKLVNVTWEGRQVTMFTQDIRARGEKID